MAGKAILITDKAVEKLPLAEEGQYWALDSELIGFGVLVGKRVKTFMVRGEFWRDEKREFSTRLKIGNCQDMKTREARVKAKEILASIAKGVRPWDTAKTRVGEITLAEAWARSRDAHLEREGRNQKTIQGYTDHMDRLFKDWLDLPLAKLGRTPRMVADLHDDITSMNGSYMANNAMRTLRAIYNHALKSDPTLPARNPTIAIDWSREVRRDTGLGPAELLA